MSNTIRWYKSEAMDAPELKSPQPCPRGVHCDYRVEKDGELVPACCRFVHPGEEGNGRRIFPARQVKEGGAEASFQEQPACVRLTGGAGFYERRRLRLSWGQWCEKKGIPYTPVKAGERWEPVKRVPCGRPLRGGPATAPRRPEPINLGMDEESGLASEELDAAVSLSDINLSVDDVNQDMECVD